ncbi:MAG TPA: hypothetical protein DEQ30_07865, partial [Porphyromonadaceae bacterium]|nr:hypothetical protein [Porphyromonadaceae bacterium]
MKYFLYILLVAIVLFVGFWAIIIVSLSGIGKFYVPFIFISAILLLVFAFLHIFHFVASKKMKKIWLLFLSLMLVSCAIYEGRNAYDRSILRV